MKKQASLSAIRAEMWEVPSDKLQIADRSRILNSGCRVSRSKQNNLASDKEAIMAIQFLSSESNMNITCILTKPIFVHVSNIVEDLRSIEKRVVQ